MFYLVSNENKDKHKDFSSAFLMNFKQVFGKQ